MRTESPGLQQQQRRSHGGVGERQDAARRQARRRAQSQSATSGKSAQRRHQGCAGGFSGPPRSPGREAELSAVPGGRGGSAGQLRGQQRGHAGARRSGHREPGLLTVAADPGWLSTGGEWSTIMVLINVNKLNSSTTS